MRMTRDIFRRKHGAIWKLLAAGLQAFLSTVRAVWVPNIEMAIWEPKRAAKCVSACSKWEL